MRRAAYRAGGWLFGWHPSHVVWSWRPRVDQSPRHWSVVWLGVEVARAK